MSYYAVKKGHKVGIFEQWDECQRSISGFSGAEYRKFNTKVEAEAYLENRDIWKEKIDKDIENGYLVAFTDGSFDKQLGRYSYGVLIVAPDKKEYELCGYGNNPKYISTQNIIGEILGSINAMDWAVSNGYEKIKIYHDYEGLAKWISGEWKAESDVARMYKAILTEKYAGLLDIAFEAVKGHSNNSYNDKVDILAKSALHDRKYVAIEGDNWFCIPNFPKDDFVALLDLIKEVDCNIQLHPETFATKTIYRLKLNSHKLTLTYFDSGDHKILVQGQTTILFQIVVSLLNELEDIKCERILSNAYRKTIDTKIIDDAFNIAFPTFPVDYPANNKKLIRQSIINLQYYIESEDYAQYAFPALRALEGHIKYLISTAGGALGRSFSDFNKDASGAYIYVGTLVDTSKKPQIEKCYRFYKSHRDTIFHFGDLLGSTDTTRMVSSKEEADEIIKRCIDLMCEL